MNQKRALEQYRVFPFLAWFAIIIASLSLGHLLISLNHSLADLDHRTSHLEQIIQSHQLDL